MMAACPSASVQAVDFGGVEGIEAVDADGADLDFRTR